MNLFAKRGLVFIVMCIIPISILAMPNIKKITGTDLLTSKEITVSAEGKKGLVAIFLSAKCPCSNSHISELKNLSKSFPEFSFVAIHSNADENKDISIAYFEKNLLPFPTIEDQKTTLANLFQAYKTPHAYILSPNGDVIYQGGVTNSHDFEKSDRKYLREALTDIDAGKSVRTPEARTLGCSIARGSQ